MNYLIIAGIILIIYITYSYNRMIKLRNIVREGWSGVDVQLKRRRNLIPLLSRAVSSYKEFEKETFERIAELRKMADETYDVKEREKLEEEFKKELEKVIVLFENYPELRAAQLYTELQDKLTEIEDNIQFARRFYNGAVRDYNTFISIFPNNIIAKLGGFKEAEFFELGEESERKAPKISLGREK